MQVERLEETRSNFRFQATISITVHFDKYDPTRAGKYIELPKFIQLKKACVNIKDADHRCLKYCIASLAYDKIHHHDPEAMFHYKSLNDDMINWKGVKFPSSNRDIDRLEQNKDGLASIDEFEPDELFSAEKVIKARTTSNKSKNYKSITCKTSH